MLRQFKLHQMRKLYQAVWMLARILIKASVYLKSKIDGENATSNASRTSGDGIDNEIYNIEFDTASLEDSVMETSLHKEFRNDNEQDRDTEVCHPGYEAINIEVKNSATKSIEEPYSGAVSVGASERQRLSRANLSSRQAVYNEENKNISSGVYEDKQENYRCKLKKSDEHPEKLTALKAGERDEKSAGEYKNAFSAESLSDESPDVYDNKKYDHRLFAEDNPVDNHVTQVVNSKTELSEHEDFQRSISNELLSFSDIQPETRNTTPRNMHLNEINHSLDGLRITSDKLDAKPRNKIHADRNKLDLWPELLPDDNKDNITSDVYMKFEAIRVLENHMHVLEITAEQEGKTWKTCSV